MKKVLLFIGLLVLVMLGMFMNVREGASDSDDKKIDRDKNTFNDLWNKAKPLAKWDNPKSKSSTPLENLRFSDGNGQKLYELVQGYKHSKREKNIVMGSTFDQAMAALNYRKNHN